jgi:hypothetical protein
MVAGLNDLFVSCLQFEDFTVECLVGQIYHFKHVIPRVESGKFSENAHHKN